jgi:hypothetical protein
MTDILFHKILRTGRHHIRHTYLVDVGTMIDIPLMEVSDLFESCILDPPYPKTRFFEIVIDEPQDTETKSALFQTIYPVLAERKPDWRLLIFRIKQGSLNITERIHFRTDTGEAQWLYSNDFNLLYLSSGGRLDLDMLLHQITGRLSAIAESFSTGRFIPSEFENQLSYRTAIDSIFSKGVEGAFRDAVIYQDYTLPASDKLSEESTPPSGTDTCSHHGKAVISLQKLAALSFDINEIEDLRDLSWLST